MQPVPGLATVAGRGAGPMKTGANRHPKITLLMGELDIPRTHAVGVVESVFLYAVEFCPDGNIGRYPAEVVAREIGYEGDAQGLLDALATCGWLDRQDGKLLIHDWPEHCADLVHKRLARKAARFADGTMPKLTRLAAKEREEIERKYAAKTPERPACARRTPGGRPLGAIPIPTEPNPAHSNRTQPSRAEPDPVRPENTGPQPIGEILPDLAARDGAEYRRRLFQRIGRASGDGAEWRDTWKAVLGELDRLDGLFFLDEKLHYAEMCADPAQRAAKDLGALKKPGAWLWKQCQQFIEEHGGTMPAMPKRKAC